MSETKETVDFGTVELTREDRGVVGREVDGKIEKVRQIVYTARANGETYQSMQEILTDTPGDLAMALAREELVHKEAMMQHVIRKKLEKIGWFGGGL